MCENVLSFSYPHFSYFLKISLGVCLIDRARLAEFRKKGRGGAVGVSSGGGGSGGAAKALEQAAKKRAAFNAEIWGK